MSEATTAIDFILPGLEFLEPGRVLPVPGNGYQGNQFYGNNNPYQRYRRRYRRDALCRNGFCSNIEVKDRSRDLGIKGRTFIAVRAKDGCPNGTVADPTQSGVCLGVVWFLLIVVAS